MNNSKKLINILQIIDAAPYGGAQKIAISIHRYASSKNYKFHYLLINRDDKEHKSRAIFEKFGYSFTEVNLYFVRAFPSYRFARFLQSCLIGFLFLTAILKFKVKIAHIHIYQSFYLLPIFRVLKLFRMSWVWTLHGNVGYTPEFREKIKKFVVDYKDRQDSFKITQVTPGINETLLLELIDEEVYPTIVNNGIDLGKYSFSLDARTRIRRQLNLKDYEILIGTVGRIEYEKGIDVLIEAFERFSEKKNIKLVIIGEGSFKDRLIDLVSNKQWCEKVFFVGSQNNVPDWLSAFDIYIQPSRAEGLSLAVIEALSVGIPVIATDVGGTNELLDGGKSGVLISKGSAEAIADAVKSLIDNVELRKKLSGKALEQAKNYSREKMVKAYLDIYHSLL